MKPARTIIILSLLGLVAVAGALFLRGKTTPPTTQATPAPPAITEQTFAVRGQILSLDEHAGIVKIAHEEIPGYMPAMTMPFMVRDSNSLRKVKAGDTVRFKLAVTSDDSWISEIEKIANGVALPEPPANPQTDQGRLQAGEKVPEFSFVDQNGKARSSADFSGKFLAVTFIYTRCPLPNFCPLLGKKFTELQGRLSKEFPGKFHLLSVSIDPQYDTPQVLKGYSSIHTTDSSTWTYATGTPEQVATIAGLFGLTYSEKNPGLIDHDMRTALIAPDGRLLHIWKSNFWTPYEIRNRIAEWVPREKLATNP